MQIINIVEKEKKKLYHKGKINTLKNRIVCAVVKYVCNYANFTINAFNKFA